MSQVIVMSHKANQTERVELPFEIEPSGYQDVELYHAQIVDLEAYSLSGNGVIYTSPARMGINACANAIEWAIGQGHEILTGDDVTDAFALASRKLHAIKN